MIVKFRCKECRNTIIEYDTETKEIIKYCKKCSRMGGITVEKRISLETLLKADKEVIKL